MSKTTSKKANSKSKESIRILHIAFTLHDKAIQDWLLYVLKNTKSNEVQVDLMTTLDEVSVFQETVDDIKGKLHICPHPKMRGAFLRYVREVLEGDIKYDIVHVHPFILGGAIMKQAFRADVPVRLMHAHLDRRKFRRNKSWVSRFRHKISNLLIQRLSTHGLASNVETAEDIYGSTWHGDGRWKVMPYGIDLSIIKKSEDQNLKAKLGVPARAKVIAQIGDFYFEKNHEFTLRLFEQEAQKNLSLILLLAGQGPLREKIENQTLKMGLDERVIFVDKDISDTEILSITDLLAMPALYERDVAPLIQAQILGVPALVSDVISRDVDLSDDLIHFMPLGEDISVWSKACHNMMTKNASKTDRAYERAIESNYNIDKNVETLKGLYQEVIVTKLKNTSS